MVLTLDNLPARLPSHSSTTLLLCTTLPFSNNSIPTLVNSSIMDNFIDESLVTSPQLYLRSAWLFVINVHLNGLSQVLPTLVNSGTSSAFVSSQLNFQHNDLDKLLELQLFERSPAMTGVTQYYDNTLTLDNDLWFQTWLLVTQLPPLTPIMLGLLWLQDVNPDINWKNLIMQFPGPKASLAAAIPLCLQSILDSDVSDSGTSTSRATLSPSISNAEHLEHVRHILEQLQEYHLHAKPKKCSFHMTEVEYFGVIITFNSVCMDPTKINAILNWPPP
ncbi:hypothetical protein E4T56_gene2722 [Termitomyces sp. T112]|nr:hypothetical protein E4T56_gene2722 [Termitomyces sp. T112]